MIFDLNKPHCRYFSELSAIPRASRNEAAASAYVLQFAKEHGLECWHDEWGNTIVRKPGSKGHEEEPWLMLQAHLDMVPACDPGVEHDWQNDPLELYVDGDDLKAKGTTLGADDGVGVAMMLAILADETMEHPPLECVFTVMEEIGLEGALRLKPEHILSRRVISLDGGGETATMCCAAGGIKESAVFRTVRKPFEGTAYRLSVHGLLGGHSGIAISENRANAILLMVRWLYEWEEAGIEYRLVRIQGGQGDNSIAADAEAVLITSAAKERVLSCMERFAKEIRAEYRESDPDIVVDCELCTAQQNPLDEASQRDLLAFLESVPNGVFAISLQMDGLPVTSSNIGLIETEEEKITALYRIRSLYESGLDDVLRHMRAASSGKPVQLGTIIRYPGWPIASDSPLRDTLNQVIRRRYHRDVTVEGTHGGNETGIWYGLHPDSDIISIGSVEENIHTPQEKLNLPAFDRMYDLLKELVTELCRDGTRPV